MHQNFNKEIEECFAQFSEMVHLKLKNDEYDVIVFIGRTGASKTTFASYVAGYKLIFSRNPETNRWEFQVVDFPVKIGNTNHSETVIPNKLPVQTAKKTCAILIDCPGIEDTHGYFQDIINRFLSRKYLAHFRKVRLVCCVNDSIFHNKGIDFEKMIGKFGSMIDEDDEDMFDKIADASCLTVTQTEQTRENCMFTLKTYLKEKMFTKERVKKFLNTWIGREAVHVFNSPQDKGGNTMQDTKLTQYKEICAHTKPILFQNPSQALDLRYPPPETLGGEQEAILKAANSHLNSLKSWVKQLICNEIFNVGTVKTNSLQHYFEKSSILFSEIAFVPHEDDLYDYVDVNVHKINQEQHPTNLIKYIHCALDLVFQDTYMVRDKIKFKDLIAFLYCHEGDDPERKSVIAKIASIHKLIDQFLWLFGKSADYSLQIPVDYIINFIIDGLKFMIENNDEEAYLCHEIISPVYQRAAQYSYPMEFGSKKANPILETSSHTRPQNVFQAALYDKYYLFRIHHKKYLKNFKNNSNEENHREAKNLFLEGVMAIKSEKREESLKIKSFLSKIADEHHYFYESLILDNLSFFNPPTPAHMEKLISDFLGSLGKDLKASQGLENRSKLFFNVCKCYLFNQNMKELYSNYQKMIHYSKHDQIKQYYQLLNFSRASNATKKLFSNEQAQHLLSLSSSDNTGNFAEALSLLYEFECNSKFDNGLPYIVKGDEFVQKIEKQSREEPTQAKDGMFVKFQHTLNGGLNRVVRTVAISCFVVCSISLMVHQSGMLSRVSEL